MRTPWILPLLSMVPLLACFGDAPRIDGATSGPAGTTGASSSATDVVDATSAEASTADPTDAATTDAGVCDAGGIAVPSVPDGWRGPFFAYGMQGGRTMPPDCGGETRGQTLGTFVPGLSACACLCDESPSALCGVDLLACDDSTIGPLVECTDIADAVGVKFTSIPQAECSSTLHRVVKGDQDAVFMCEVVVEDGCTSNAQLADGLCIAIDGEMSACPEGYESLDPVILDDLRCEGTCDTCELNEFCASGARLDHFGQAGCQGMPIAQSTAGMCPAELAASVRMAPIPAACAPVNPAEIPTPITVCCAP